MAILGTSNGTLLFTHYASLEALHAVNPEFRGEKQRKLLKSDFGPQGIRSQILRDCLHAGMTLDDIGIAEVEEGGCGDGRDDLLFAPPAAVCILRRYQSLDRDCHSPIAHRASAA